jgi:hypothetical protein
MGETSSSALYREVTRIGDSEPRPSWTFAGSTEAYPRDDTMEQILTDLSNDSFQGHAGRKRASLGARDQGGRDLVRAVAYYRALRAQGAGGRRIDVLGESDVVMPA